MNAIAPKHHEELLVMDPYKIKIRDEQRIRQITPRLEEKITAIMISFQAHGQLHRISIDEEDFLISGYLRLVAARRLTMEIKVVKKYGLSDYQKLEIEIQENATRFDFTSYELTVGLAELKRKFKLEYPDIKRGPIPQDSITARGALIQNEEIPNFARTQAKAFNVSERTI